MSLCLISCNIRFDNPADGDNVWHRRRDLLVETLLKHSPDVIATQEGRYDQLKNLEELLVDFELVDQHRSWIRERMYPSFYIRKNKFELVKSEDLWLSETPEIAGSISFGSAFPRLMTWLKLQPKGSAEDLILVNTHFDHVKQETRLSQAKVLAGEMKRVWQGECPIVIMGDFNDSPESDVRKIITDEFSEIQDAWKLFHSLEESSHHSFSGEVLNGSRIDWVLVDKRLKVKDCQLDKTSQGGRYPTDHYPVICTIDF